ncbi:MAG TPA: hypothetical protein VN753_12860 [Terracidiphilus sp.]|jgi:hypothetical protein|nr:hypothetical protein [Terracidiphilus sp.]
MRKFFLAVLFLGISSLLAAQQTLNNDGVVKMVKAGLSEDVIVAAVTSSPGTYDTSTEALVALKSAGVGDKVMGAIVMKASGPAPAAAATGVSLPKGIDEVGVYYRDRGGNWVALMPEVVNFKSGGAMKKFMTNGIVKNDINGHIEGKSAKTQVTLPVVFAVYVSEGTAITEYQLVRLRQQSGSREFRSKTGGVIHESGGAKRDLVEFQSEKLAPRLYQVTLDSSAGKGEYGLIPPGSYSSANMASGGKIYSLSVLE